MILRRSIFVIDRSSLGRYRCIYIYIRYIVRTNREGKKRKKNKKNKKKKKKYIPACVYIMYRYIYK